MILTAGELRERNPWSIEDIKASEELGTSNYLLYSSLYSTVLRDNVKHGKPYRASETFALTEEERLRWNEHAVTNLHPKYNTERSKARLEKSKIIIEMTQTGHTIRQIKEVVGCGSENMGESRRRAVRCGKGEV